MDEIQWEIPNNFQLPRRINRLGKFAYNLWWVWHPEAQVLFSEIDKILWHRENHNPVSFLQKVDASRLDAAINNLSYLNTYDQIMKNFDQHITSDNTWFSTKYKDFQKSCIAYFSFEFGLHETLPVYAGGLGVLSGDHLKEASDLGLPMVGVGFIYQQGYFTQHITEDGWQETSDYHLDFNHMPIIPLFSDGKPVTIDVDLPGRKVVARLWGVRIGRIPLILLDSNNEENSVNDRQLTARLYSNAPEVRISQEILLGIGGVRALRKLGYDPYVWHMNEGHSAFLVLERTRELVDKGMSFDQAAEKVRQTNVFTTHTPVPAGNDQFPAWLVERCFYNMWSDLGLDRDTFINLASQSQPWGENFIMPALALRFSNYRNAVSELHGHISRQMWHYLWEDVDVDDVPITHITNGVHVGSWLARRLANLYAKYLGYAWLEHVDDPELWAHIENIPDKELWETHLYLKRKLLSYITERARLNWLHKDWHPVQIIAGGVLMDPEALTIGFARRFAVYKRGNLVLRNYERLLQIINNADMPVQIVFSGKSHPADEPGKRIIQEVYRAVKDAKTGGRLIFLDDYDMNVARYLVQGVDVWMNTPRRPNEASGTSGMKAALNGVINFSVLDGWWCEGYDGKNGWVIGDEQVYENEEEQDDLDSNCIYDVLENQIVPLYYKSRSADDLPNEWIAMMKESIRTLIPKFSMRRMVKEYTTDLYAPALQNAFLDKNKD